MGKLRRFTQTCLLSFGLLLPQREAAAQTTNASSDFSAWVNQLKIEARNAGISAATLESAFPDTLQPIPRVLELDRKQPENTKTFQEYLSAVVSDTRIEQGRAQLAAHRDLLDSIGAAYDGVDPEIIVALWGIETNYGQRTGGYDVIPALATLAYDGRRSAFFKAELLKALRIIDEGHVPADSLKGSWAGALGQIQFMPSSFFVFARDGDGDGRKDIWKNHADIFASAANYLRKSGWREGQIWGEKVELPDGFDRALISSGQRYTLDFWRKKGVTLPGGQAIPSDNRSDKAALIQPDGAGTPVYLVYDNYRTILKWNNAKSFAASAGMLAEKLKFAP